MRFGLVGCGLIGQKRARSLGPEHELVAAVDVTLARAEPVGRLHPNAILTEHWRDVVTRHDLDAVIVATTNDALASVSTEAIRAHKHVLVEKPAARNSAELRPLLQESQTRGVCVQVGFNHRFHPSLRKARQIFESGALGPLMFIRGRYGHGGRVGYEREWRADPARSGGGELLDQGVHLIDLASWFLGRFVEIDGFAHTYFWNMPVEDNGFMLLRTAQQQVAFLHASCTEWKNMFSFEIYGRDGKLQIDGLGGSYGVERLSYYRMLPQMGPPETTIWEYPGEDTSWKSELEAFARFVGRGETPQPGLSEAIACLEIVEKVYTRSDA